MNLFSFPSGFFFFAINSIFCRISSENSAEACSSWLVWNVRLVHYFILIKSYLESKPVSAAGISENNTERLSKKMNRNWRRTEASRANVKFWGQSFSRGHYPSIYQQGGKGYIYYNITLWIVVKVNGLKSFLHIMWIFFCLLVRNCQPAFLFLRRWLLQNGFLVCFRRRIYIFLVKSN